MNSVTEYLTFNLSGRVRREKLEGRDHLVVPTVMIVEGVLNGSNGPLLYPATELADSPTVWDHKPIVVGHPNGATACSPAVLNDRKVGVLLRTRWDAPKLRTEAWIDRARAKAIDARIVERLESNKKIEVSTGLRVVPDGKPGEYRGKRYDAIARRYRPDHLAILMDEVGACSIADGAGMLALNSGPLTPSEIQKAIKMLMPRTGPPIQPSTRPVETPRTMKVYNSWILKPGTEVPHPKSSDEHKQEPIPKPVWNWDKPEKLISESESEHSSGGQKPIPRVEWKW